MRLIVYLLWSSKSNKFWYQPFWLMGLVLPFSEQYHLFLPIVWIIISSLVCSSEPMFHYRWWIVAETRLNCIWTCPSTVGKCTFEYVVCLIYSTITNELLNASVRNFTLNLLMVLIKFDQNHNYLIILAPFLYQGTNF